MAQVKEDVYSVVLVTEDSETGEFGHNVFMFKNTSLATAVDQAYQKYFELLSIYWNNSAYDYVAVDLIRVMDNVCIKADYKDSRLEPEIVNP